MVRPPLRVLLVEDNDGDADLVVEALNEAGEHGAELARVDRLSAAADRLSLERFDVVLLDLSLPDASGLDGLERLRAAAPSAPIVVLTGTQDAAVGTRAIQSGAQDFLQKGQFHGSVLLRAIHYARERAQFTDRVRLLSAVGTALSSSIDGEQLKAALSDTLGKGFCNWCKLDCAPEVTAHDELLPKPEAAAAPGHLFASLQGTAADHPERKQVEALLARGMTSAMWLPFHAKGWLAGSLTFARTAHSRPYDAADLALAEEITRRTVAAFEYAALLGVAQRERERAEIAGRARDEFLATLSHELRTPLNAILGWTVMLRSGQVAQEKQPKALETIERNVRAQVALINDVLDVSRIITGKIRLTVVAVDLAQVLASALESIRPAAESKGIKLDVESDPSVKTVQADADRLLQVLWNLFSNAVKFTPKGGTVSVRVRRDEAAVEVVVSDTGHGIAADFLPHVFERFRQANSTMTRTHGGLGLGLAIARHLVPWPQCRDRSARRTARVLPRICRARDRRARRRRTAGRPPSPHRPGPRARQAGHCRRSGSLRSRRCRSR